MMSRGSLLVCAVLVWAVGCRGTAPPPVTTEGALDPAPALEAQRVLPAPPPEPPAPPPARVVRRVAVFGTRAAPDRYTEADEFLLEVKAALARTGAFEVVTRRHVGEIEEELELAARGLLDPTTAPRLGRIHGVSYLLEATEGSGGTGAAHTVLLLINAETASVVAQGESDSMDRREAIAQAASRLAEATAALPLKPGDVFESP